MRLSEDTTKQILRAEGASIPRGTVVSSPGEVEGALSGINLPVMVKANSRHGRRWKAGLVASAGSIREAQDLAESFLGSQHENESITSVLIEARSQPADEIFLAITVDDRLGLPTLLVSRHGGVDVESAITAQDEEIQVLPIDPIRGLKPFDAVPTFKALRLDGPILRPLATTAAVMWNAYSKSDATVLEVNPLGLLDTQSVLILDAKMAVDDDAMFRHPELSAPADEGGGQQEAFDRNVRYTDLGGNIAILSGGAGMTMAIADALIQHGGSPANFLDTIGGADAEGAFSLASAALQKVANDPEVRVLLVNLSLVASPMAPFIEGFERAFREIPPGVPVVGIVRGTGAATTSMSREEARKRMEGLGVELFDTIEETVLASVRVASRDAEL